MHATFKHMHATCGGIQGVGYKPNPDRIAITLYWDIKAGRMVVHALPSLGEVALLPPPLLACAADGVVYLLAPPSPLPLPPACQLHLPVVLVSCWLLR